jgi:Cellulase (glycosyl hydrolase family 5)
VRKLLALVVAAAVACGVAAAVWIALRGHASESIALPQDPMPGRALLGFQDDPTLRWGADRAEMLTAARRAGATVIRTTVVWAQAAPRRPAHPAHPFDPAYRLDDVDELARTAQRLGMELQIDIWGTPGWANRGQKPNRAPSNPDDLRDFAQALADRYSGRHPGYPAVRLFSAWNEPNLQLFLAPQFDARGRPVAPAAYARISRAVYDGVKRGNPEALVAIGETSARGHDAPGRGGTQDSESPARFAQLLAEARPRVRFDAWAVHPYPQHPAAGPFARVRWPAVGLASLGRFGQALDRWFGRHDIPIWLTEYGFQTRPSDPVGISPAQQARFVAQTLQFVEGDPRVRMLLWFTFRDQPGNPWKSGLIDQQGRPKPALARFASEARRLDAQDPVVPAAARAVRLPAFELAYYAPTGSGIEVHMPGTSPFSVPLGRDGWLKLPLRNVRTSTVRIWATDGLGHFVSWLVRRR